jgi:peptidoglycan/LPS O-acetylase OafA/YrhL
VGARHLGTVPGLDGIRGIAVLLVVLVHLENIMADRWFTPAGGFLGVDLFFVLSGFLITALLLEEDDNNGEVRLGAFYVRRALRLLPALWVFLAVHLVFAAHATKAPYTYERAVGLVRASALYVNNWYVNDDPLGRGYGDLGHLWSLAVEEQFYIVWPIMLIGLLSLRRPRLALAVIVGLILIVAVNRARLYLTWPDDQSRWYINLLTGTDVRVDSLLVGALAAWLWSLGLVPTRHLRAAAAVASGVVVAVLLTTGNPQVPFVFLGGYTLFAAAAAVVVIATVDTDWVGNRVLRLGPLRVLGKVSYGVYLWHNAVIWALVYYGASLEIWERVVVFLGATIALTTASWFLVERPALRLKRRFERRRPPVTADEAAGAPVHAAVSTA